MKRFLAAAALSLALLAPCGAAVAQDIPQVSLQVTAGGPQAPGRLVPAVKILLLLTVLSIAPALLVAVTSFTRIVIVLSFVRQAIGSQGAPPANVITTLALLLTFVVMAPVAQRVNDEAFTPYSEDRISEMDALDRARLVVSDFLLRQTREDDIGLFYELTHTERPARAEDVKFHLLVPAFMISELRTGFEMGFLLFLPFVLIDLVTASVLTSMGMVMMPPTTISTPLKLLLFVSVDGWALLTRSLVASFS